MYERIPSENCLGRTHLNTTTSLPSINRINGTYHASLCNQLSSPTSRYLFNHHVNGNLPQTSPSRGNNHNSPSPTYYESIRYGGTRISTPESNNRSAFFHDIDLQRSEQNLDTFGPVPTRDNTMNEVEYQLLRAKRRRDQVRAASQRCRSRQRRMTEELRIKVTQLEELNRHTVNEYKQEIARLEGIIDTLRQENENLLHHVSSANASDSTSPIRWNAEQCEYAIEMIERATKELKELSLVHVNPLIAKTRTAIKWEMLFWADEKRYYARSYKFLHGIRAADIANRVQNVDVVKLKRVFTEIQDVQELMRLSPNLKLAQWTKEFPGKGITTSCNLEYLKQDDYALGGERWVTASISVESGYLDYDGEVNGYIFQDTIQIKDGRTIHGCLAMGVGRYAINHGDKDMLMEELANRMASVVVRWEDLYVNDYVKDDEDDEQTVAMKMLGFCIHTNN